MLVRNYSRNRKILNIKLSTVITILDRDHFSFPVLTFYCIKTIYNISPLFAQLEINSRRHNVVRTLVTYTLPGLGCWLATFWLRNVMTCYCFVSVTEQTTVK